MPGKHAAPHVIVAGLGAMGSSLAYHLARRGARVTGFDLHAPPHDLGSSHGASRIIREAYFEDPSYVPLVRRAYAAWHDLENASGSSLLTTTGALIIGPSDAPAVRGTETSAREHGIPHRVLDSAGMRREFPELRPRPHEIGIHETRAGVLAPEACISAHLAGARAHGADLRFDEPLTDWEPGGSDSASVRAVTPSGRHTADALVLATGPWLPSLLPDLNLTVERQVQVWLRARTRPESFSPDRFPVFLWEHESGVFYGVPDMGGGIKAARHHGGATAASIQDLPAAVSPVDIAPVSEFLARCIPAAAGEVIGSAVCRYTNTPDHHFLIDRVPQQPNVWTASACSGHGFKFTSALGDLLAGEITGGETAPELAMFRGRTAVRRVSGPT